MEKKAYNILLSFSASMKGFIETMLSSLLVWKTETVNYRMLL